MLNRFFKNNNLPKTNFLVLATIFSISVGCFTSGKISFYKVESIFNAINYSVNNQISNQEYASFLSLKSLITLEKNSIQSTSIYNYDSNGTLYYRSGAKLDEKYIDDVDFSQITSTKHLSKPGYFIHYNLFPKNKLVSIIVMKDPAFFYIASTVSAALLTILILASIAFNRNLLKIVFRILRQFLHEVKHDRTVRKMLSSLPAIINPNLSTLAKPVAEPLDHIINDLAEKYVVFSEVTKNYDHGDLHVLDILVFPVFGNLIKNASKHGNDEPIEISTNLNDKYLIFSVKNGLFNPLSEEQKKILRTGKHQDKDGMAIIHENLRHIKGKIDFKFQDSIIEIIVKTPRKQIEAPKPRSLVASDLGIKSVAILDDVSEERTRLWSQVYKTLKISAARYSHIDYLYNDLQHGKKFDLIICDQQGTYDSGLRSWDAVLDGLDNKIKDDFGMKDTVLILHSKGGFSPSRKNKFDSYVQKDPKNDWSKILPKLFLA